ncbi:MAG TPA: trehalase family glycosidase [Trueperaceae bacterium]
MSVTSEGLALDGHERNRLIGEARALLRRNHTGRFTKPSLGQYPHQWNWDSAFIVFGLDRLDADLARSEVRSLLEAQWENGMLPHIVYSEGHSDYFPTPEFWGTSELSGTPPVATSGLTQPPVLASAVRTLVEHAGDQREGDEFARDVFPALLRWHRWLHEVRAVDGLVAIVHPWESGTDNSTRFRTPLANLGEVRAPEFARRDQTHVAVGERPVQEDYDRFMYLIARYRTLGWDYDTLVEHAPFLVQDVLFNSILHAADADLMWLARRLGEQTDELESWLNDTRAAFDERFWNEEAGLYFDYDLRAGKQIEESTCATFMPLYAGIAGERQAERLVRQHLLDPGQYAPGDGSRYLLPSVSKSSPYFEPRRYWRGPIWLNVNWLVARGLERYGHHEQARLLREHSIELVSRSGFVEYYDPRDGTACGAAGFSWSAALAVDMLLST